MTEEVKRCVEMRTGFFDQYFTVPDSQKNDVDSFIRETEELGERCQDASAFESQFASAGLAARFNDLISKCVPKPVKMSREDIKASKETAREILQDNRKELMNDALDDAAEDIRENIHDANLQANHERMIENGTIADHTILKNHIEDAFGLFKTLKGKGKTKKND